MMSSPEVHHLFHHPIADHSFSADRQTLAVTRDNSVELYNRSSGKFTLQDELKGHDKTITSVDIAPTTGRIVTCSQGQSFNAFLPSRTAKADVSQHRSQCLRLGAIALWMEANPCPAPYQPRRNLCAMVSLGEEICGWIWRSSHCSVLLRGRE